MRRPWWPMPAPCFSSASPNSRTRPSLEGGRRGQRLSQGSALDHHPGQTGPARHRHAADGARSQQSGCRNRSARHHHLGQRLKPNLPPPRRARWSVDARRDGWGFSAEKYSSIQVKAILPDRGSCTDRPLRILTVARSARYPGPRLRRWREELGRNLPPPRKARWRVDARRDGWGFAEEYSTIESNIYSCWPRNTTRRALRASTLPALRAAEGELVAISLRRAKRGEGGRPQGGRVGFLGREVFDDWVEHTENTLLERSPLVQTPHPSRVPRATLPAFGGGGRGAA